MKRTIQVTRHTRVDGSVVEAHKREIEADAPDSLTDEIRKRREEKRKQDALFQFAKEE